MKLYQLTPALVALAAAAVLTTSAHAQNANYTSGDLILGFEETGAANDYVVDLGPASQLTSDQSFQLSTTDLAADFGTNWAASNANVITNPDLQWGLVANDNQKVVQSNANTIWFTQAEQVPGTPNTPLSGDSAATLHSISNTIQNLETASSGGFLGTTPTSDTTNAINQSAAAANSWSSFAPGVTGFGIGFAVEQPNNVGPTEAVEDLFEYIPGTPQATLLGTLSLSDTGLLTFDAAPEPASYALGLTAVLLFLVLKRRKAISSVA